MSMQTESNQNGTVGSEVLPATIVYTDEAPRYSDIGGIYDHRRINHAERVYVSGDVHTNTICQKAERDAFCRRADRER